MLFQRVAIDGRSDDGALFDVRVDGGAISVIGSSGSVPNRPGEATVDGGLLTPPIAEPHVHLDAALLGARTPNRSGTLREGIANWSTLRSALTTDDVVDRATRTAEMYASQGALRIRTHVDTGSLLAVEAMVSVREQLAHLGVELQIVAFPQEGILRAPGREQAWADAVRLGCDAVGAIPHFERTTEEGWESLKFTFQMAETHHIAVDVHCDETDDPSSRHLEVMAALTADRGWGGGRVVAGHCTAMHSYPNPHAAKVVELVAEAGIVVVTNPLDNVVLQGRYDGYPRRRGLTRVDELWEGGALVGIGHDSVQDPWYRLGTANMLDPAYMLIHLGHLTGESEIRKVLRTLWTTNHLPFGEAPTVCEGANQVLWWPEADLIELIRTRPSPTVFNGATP